MDDDRDPPHDPAGEQREPRLPDEIVAWEAGFRERQRVERLQRERPSELPPWRRPVGRGAFIATVASGLGALLLASRFQGVSRGLRNAAQSLNPGGGWRIYTVASSMPVFEPSSFQLKISGLVEHPMTLSWSEVAAMPGHRQVNDFHCVTGWSVEHVHWEGILPSHIVDLVQPKASAKFVQMISSEEPYVDQISMSQFLEPGSLLAREMDHKPITQEHGAPLRMVLPDMYGYKGVKWVRELKFGAKEERGYWEQRGYDTDAFVGHSNGRG